MGITGRCLWLSKEDQVPSLATWLPSLATWLPARHLAARWPSGLPAAAPLGGYRSPCTSAGNLESPGNTPSSELP